MSTFRELARAVALEFVDSGRPVIVRDVVREAQDRHPDEYDLEAERLAFNAASREVKMILRDMSEDDGTGQLSLPGIDLPTLIALPADGADDFVYKRSADCTYDELLAGRSVRANNVNRAQQKLDHYDEQLRILRPAMEGTARTVTEALA